MVVLCVKYVLLTLTVFPHCIAIDAANWIL